jgi:hypothetical protein
MPLSDKQDSDKTLLKSEIEGIVAEEAINLQKAPKLINRELSFAEQQKIDVLDAILQTTDRESRQKAIVRAAETLGKSPRTIKRMIGGSLLNNLKSSMAWISSKLPFVKNVLGKIDHPFAKVGHDVLKAVGYGKSGGGSSGGNNKLENRLV